MSNVLCTIFALCIACALGIVYHYHGENRIRNRWLRWVCGEDAMMILVVIMLLLYIGFVVLSEGLGK